MSAIAGTAALEQRLERLTPPLAVVLPGRPAHRLEGRRGHGAAERPRGRSPTSSTGEIGKVGEDYVEGRLDFDGSMRDVMALAAAADGRRSDRGRRRGGGAAGRLAGAAARLARSTARHRPRGRRRADPVPLRRLRRLLRALARPAAGLFLRLLPRRRHDAGAGAGGQARPHLPQADAAARASASSTSAPAGAACCCGRPSTTACAAHGITLSRNQHAYVNQRDRGARPAPAGCAMDLLDYREPARRTSRSTRSPRSACSSTSAGRSCRPTSPRSTGLLKPGGLLLNHGITAGGTRNHQLGAGMGDFIERYIFPGGELLHVSQGARGDERVGARGGRRREPAPALRAHAVGLERRARGATRGGARAHLRDRGARLPAVSRRQRDGASSGAGSRCTRCCARGRTGDSASGPMRGAQSAFPFNRGYMYP